MAGDTGDSLASAGALLKVGARPARDDLQVLRDSLASAGALLKALHVAQAHGAEYFVTPSLLRGLC